MLDRKLKANYRCLYWASPSTVSEFKSFLGGQGVDVEHETARGNLILWSGQDHLMDGLHFDAPSTIEMVTRMFDQAVSDGHQGLWGTGDIAWEFEPNKDFSKLSAYERLLENVLHQNANIEAVCQYRADMLPREVMRTGLLSHPRVLVDESSCFLNSWYSPESRARSSELDSKLDSAIDRILGRFPDPGEIMVQLSGAMIRKAEELANSDGISLEDFIMFAVAEKIVRLEPRSSGKPGRKN